MRSIVIWAVVICGLAIAPVHAQNRKFFDVPITGVTDHAFTPDGQLFLATPTSVVQVDVGTCLEVAVLASGSNQMGIDASPSGRYLAVAEREVVGSTGVVRVIDREVGLTPGAVTSLSYVRAFGEAGAWMPAWVDEKRFVVSTAFSGSGWTPLRPVNATEGFGSPWGSVRQEAMLAVGGKWVFVAEPNSSAGEVGAWVDGTRVASYRTDWFVWEVAASRDGSQVMVPTYDGARLLSFDGSRFAQTGILGRYADNGPMGGAYSADGALLFTASWGGWGSSNALGGVRVYRTNPLSLVEVIDDVRFGWTGSFYRGPGRVTLSVDGTWLAVTLLDRVRVYDVKRLVEPGSFPRWPCRLR